MTKVEDLKNATAGLSDAKGDSTAGIAGASGDKPGIVAPVKESGPAPIPVLVEQMPVFGGDLGSYLSSHMRYPEQARAAGIEGRVGVKFVVNEDGSISDIKIMRSLGAGCDEEAVRVLAAMPKWKPGRNNGIPVKVYFTIPIVFKLQ